MKRKNV